MEQIIKFPNLEDAMQYIKDNDTERNFGYKIMCNTDTVPVTWIVKVQIMYYGEPKWITV